MRLLAARLGVMLATIVIAPSLSYLVFTLLSADSFAPLAALRELFAWQKAFFLHGDLGYDPYFGEPVVHTLLRALPVDLTMLLGGLLGGLLIGGAAGLRAVRHPGTWGTRACNVVAGLAMASPVYWMGFLVLIFFAHNGGVLLHVPIVSGQADFDTLHGGPLAILQALWVPILVCAAPIGAGVYRMTIAASREVLPEDFVRTAAAKGLPPARVLRRHVLPVAGIPVLILAASQVNLLIMNVGLMQTAFNIPGSFRYMVDAVDNGNLVYIQALIVEGCILIALANTAADLLQARIDPRVR